jgi:molecular chaperone DnaK
MLITHPERTVYSVKRLMGRGVADVQDELKLFPFRIAEGSESVIRFKLGEKTITPPEISAHILRKLKEDAEEASRRSRHASRHHGSRLFQRRPAPGH